MASETSYECFVTSAWRGTRHLFVNTWRIILQPVCSMSAAAQGLQRTMGGSLLQRPLASLQLVSHAGPATRAWRVFVGMRRIPRVAEARPPCEPGSAIGFVDGPTPSDPVKHGSIL